MPVKPFEIQVSQVTLDDLQERLARTRWTHETADVDWDHGTNGRYLKELVAHWQTRFDWRDQEQTLNRFSHFRADVDDTTVHFIHERARATEGNAPLPLVLTHGYPDSFVRFLKIIPMLTDPQAHGGDAADAFDVVVPSLPGYGFSDRPTRGGLTFRIGDIWHKLMTEVLGYERYAAHGGDWGGTVTEQLARSHPQSVVGVHLTDVPFWHLFQKPHDPSRNEESFFARNDKWIMAEGAYAMIQGTRPYSLARGLNDSPAGLAAWIIEKFQRWSDCHGDLETRFSKDELLTNIMIYWTTGTIGSSFLPYYDFTSSGPMTWMVEAFKKWTSSSDVPAGFALFPKDISQPPREWAARFFNVQRWTTMPRGGHFAAMEEPELLADDIRAFFRPLRALGLVRDGGQMEFQPHS
jgi:pimeloyl-ACP methyl ester carboxylesterase